MALALAIYSVGASTFALIPWTKRKRNLIHMVISLELMLLSIGLLLVNISYALDDLIGATLTLYLLLCLLRYFIRLVTHPFTTAALS
jgi:NADH:ubiquinone oxidoreductase subunit K